MALFVFGKKRTEEIKTPAGSCGGGCSGSAAGETRIADDCRPEVTGGIRCIKVLGSGCASCHALYVNTQSAVKEMNIPIEVEYITDLQTIVEYGVMSMPALVVNHKVVSMGKVLKAGDIQKLLR